MNKILIKNGTVVNADGIQEADILVHNETIEKIAPNIKTDGSFYKVIDAIGKLILPGGIDPHVHFSLKTPIGPTSDNFQSGSMAAIAGGTTTIIDFVTPEKNESLLFALEKRKNDVLNCLCDYSFHMSPIKWNNHIEKEMEICVKKEGISSFKTYMAYQGTIGSGKSDLSKIMAHAANLGALVSIHAEDDKNIETLQHKFLSEGKVSPKFHALSRPTEVEVNAVTTAIKMAKESNAKIYFVHISAGASTELIKKAQNAGLQVFAETCPQYLLFDDTKLTDDFYSSAPFVFSPALHRSENNMELWHAIQAGTIQTIGTDHCTFNLYGQKDLGISDFTKIPNGAGGVEHRLELLYTFGVMQNKISLEKMVALVSANPAKIFGLKNKGIIKEGYDADLVIWNTHKDKIISAKTHYQNCDSNIYEGIAVKGHAETVIRSGKILYDKDIFYHIKGCFIYRN